MKLLTLVLLSPVVYGIQHPLTFLKKPIHKVSFTISRKHDLQLLVQLRGGDIDVESVTVDLDGDVQATTTVDDATSIITNERDSSKMKRSSFETMQQDTTRPTLVLANLHTSINNVGNLYMVCLKSNPVSTILITITLISLIIWNTLLRKSDKNTQEKSMMTPQIKKIQSSSSFPISAQEERKVLPNAEKSGRGLLTSVGTAAATTLAIYQVVNRPTVPPSITSLKNHKNKSKDYDQGNNISKDDDQGNNISKDRSKISTNDEAKEDDNHEYGSATESCTNTFKGV